MAATSSSGAAVEIDWEEARRALRKAPAEIRKQLRAENKDVAAFIVDETRSERLTRQQRSAIGRLQAKADNRYGIVRISNTRRVPFAVAAFMGAKTRTGWYRRRRYSDSRRRQFPEWVGNQHTGPLAGYPYGVRLAIQRNLPRIADRYEKAVGDAIRKLDLD